MVVEDDPTVVVRWARSAGRFAVIRFAKAANIAEATKMKMHGMDINILFIQ
jgi:hypothetical protein